MSLTCISGWTMHREAGDVKGWGLGHLVYGKAK